MTIWIFSFQAYESQLMEPDLRRDMFGEEGKPLDLSSKPTSKFSSNKYPLKKRILMESAIEDCNTKKSTSYFRYPSSSLSDTSPSPMMIGVTSDRLSPIYHGDDLIEIKQRYHNTRLQFPEGIHSQAMPQMFPDHYQPSNHWFHQSRTPQSWEPRPLKRPNLVAMESRYQPSPSPDSLNSMGGSRKSSITFSPSEIFRETSPDMDSRSGQTTPDQHSAEWQKPVEHNDPEPSSSSVDEPRRSKVCSICSSPTETFHLNYGASSCFSCRAFFRRAVQKAKNPNFQCRAGGNCVINTQTRSDCRKCRFDLCLQSGMNPENVMNSEQKQVRFRKHIKKMKREDKKRSAEMKATLRKMKKLKSSPDGSSLPLALQLSDSTCKAGANPQNPPPLVYKHYPCDSFLTSLNAV